MCHVLEERYDDAETGNVNFRNNRRGMWEMMEFQDGFEISRNITKFVGENHCNHL